MGYCSYCVIWSLFWAIMEFHWSRSVLHHSDSCASYSVICDILRLVPHPARSESVVWEPPLWLCNIYCGSNCCNEADGSRCGTVHVPTWKGTEAASSTWYTCLLHCCAISWHCRPTVSGYVLLGHSCIVGLLAILSSTHRKQKRWHGWQLLVCHVSIRCILLTCILIYHLYRVPVI